MPASTVGNGIKVRYSSQVVDKDGYLVCREFTRDDAEYKEYDRWRCGYCHKHRHDAHRPWLRLREGRTDPLTMAYARILQTFE